VVRNRLGRIDIVRQEERLDGIDHVFYDTVAAAAAANKGEISLKPLALMVWVRQDRQRHAVAHSWVLAH
jgi:hypothetical protein